MARVVIREGKANDRLKRGWRGLSSEGGGKRSTETGMAGVVIREGKANDRLNLLVSKGVSYITIFFKKSYFTVSYRRCMLRTLAWRRAGLGHACQSSNMAILLTYR